MSTPPPQKLSLLTRVLAGIGILSMVLAFLGFGGLIYGRVFVVEPFRIPSGGMAPAFPIGAQFLLWKGETPVQGDVVVFRYPREPSVNYVQRIIAVGGDRVEVRGNRPVVNGIPAVWGEDSPAEFTDDRCRTHAMIGRTETLGGRSYAVLSNTGLSGPLADTDEVVVPEGHFFTLGDNRDNSEDGRRWGFLPADHVKGVAAAPWTVAPPC